MQSAITAFCLGLVSGFGAALALYSVYLPYYLAKQALREAID